ncbi:MAG: hypothetical protein ABMA15_27095 [Vicinamibacterales bacterium]
MRLQQVSPRMAVCVYAAVVVALLAYFMLDIPVQLADSFQNILAVRRRSLTEIIINNLWSTGYLRPLLFAPIKIVYELSGEHYSAWFRGVHVAQLAVTVGLFVALLRVRSWTDAAAAPLALAVCVSLHTFAGTIREAFPINTFLTIVDACLLAALIASSRPRWWSTPVALIVLVFAALTVESGLLVWVVLVAAFAAGWRGVSRAGVAMATASVAAYFVARFSVFHVSVPSMFERSTGFGLQVLEPAEIAARFGANPWPLHAYNVATSIASVLFAEPRGGVFWIVREVLALDLVPWTIVNLVACTGLTALIIRDVVTRRDRWRRWDLEDGDRLIVVFASVLVANAAMNYVYTKSVVMSPAGVFFGLAGYAAIRRWVAGMPALPPRSALVASLCLAVLATAWGIKAMGIHYNLWYSARQIRDQWAYVDDWLVRQHVELTGMPEREVKDALQADALWRRPARPRVELDGRWPAEWFDAAQ